MTRSSEPVEVPIAEEEKVRRQLSAVKAAVEEMEPLIPGLPDEVSEQCLLHLPFPYQTLVRSVSSSWNRALSSTAFQRSKAALAGAIALPYLFVFAFDRSTLRLQWQALDPRSKTWFVLPPMPLPADGAVPLCPPAFACAALPRRGELYVLGGMRADTQSPLQTLLSYRAATNSWSAAAPMTTPRCFFAAGAIGGRIFAAGGGDDGGNLAVECYDPAADRWAQAAGMRRGMARYDAAVVGRRMYVTEGWTWPFDSSPRGGVYDADRDAWEEMRVGMREGWTGASAVVGGRLYVVAEYGDGRVKAYDDKSDCWSAVGGGGVPAEVRRPYAVSGGGAEEDRIYVVGSGLDVCVGTVVVVVVAEDGAEEERVEWEVVKGPPAFADLAPCNALVLYA